MKLKRFIISAVMFPFFSLNAQMWDWAKGSESEGGVSICIDRIGGLYMASTQVFATFMGAAMTYTECGEVISHHDLQGNLLWAQKIVAGHIACISADRFGNCYATGSCYSAIFCGAQGNISVSHPGNSQAFIVKYDYNGNVLWLKTWDYPDYNDDGLGIKADDVGDIIVTGIDKRTWQQGGPPCNSFMLKFDPQGAMLWSSESNWRGTFTCGSIELDEQNNIYLAGSFIDSAAFSNVVLTTNTYMSIGVAKYDKFGNFLWAKKIGTGYIGVAGIKLDHKGNLYMTGSFSNQTNFGNITLSSPPQLGSCIFIAKFDTACNCIWAHSSQKRSGVSIATDTSGNCYLAGNAMGAVSLGSGTNSVTFNGPKQNQFFVVKYDKQGNLLWGIAPGGTSNGMNAVGSICTDMSGNCYLTGYSEETSFGPITLTTTGVFIARIGPTVSISPANNGTATVGISEIQSLQNSFSVYPNPTTGQVFLSLLNSNGLKNISLQVKNVVGQSIYEKSYDVNANEFVQEINLGHLPEGIYFIEVFADKAKEVRRIIVE